VFRDKLVFLSRDIVAVLESLAAWFNIKLHALFNYMINFQSSEKNPTVGENDVGFLVPTSSNLTYIHSPEKQYVYTI